MININFKKLNFRQNSLSGHFYYYFILSIILHKQNLFELPLDNNYLAKSIYWLFQTKNIWNQS